jgi:hypothetical protein
MLLIWPETNETISSREVWYWTMSGHSPWKMGGGSILSDFYPADRPHFLSGIFFRRPEVLRPFL